MVRGIHAGPPQWESLTERLEEIRLAYRLPPPFAFQKRSNVAASPPGTLTFSRSGDHHMAGQSSDNFNLLTRLELLDSQLRRLKTAGIFVAVFFVIILVLLILALFRVMAGGGEGEKFTLRDENGKSRASLVVTRNVPVLWFYDDNERVLGGLKMASDENGLLFYDENQKRVGQFGVSDGQPGLLLFDRKEKVRVKLTVAGDDVALLLYDAAGRVRAGLAVDKNGPHLVLKNEKGKIIFQEPKPKP
jgi:hypothetical protein